MLWSMMYFFAGSDLLDVLPLSLQKKTRLVHEKREDVLDIVTGLLSIVVVYNDRVGFAEQLF